MSRDHVQQRSGRTKKIILLSGPVSSGKSTLSKALEEEFGLQILRTRDILIKIVTSEKAPRPTDRLSLQALGDRMDEETQGRWVLNEFMELQKPSKDSTVVVDSVRIDAQIDHIRNAFPLAGLNIRLGIAVKPFRKGERWAWYASLMWPVTFLAIIASDLSFGFLPPAVAVATPVSIAGLLLPYRKFFPKVSATSGS